MTTLKADDLYRIMSRNQKQQTVSNVAGGLSQCSQEVVDRMLPHFDQCDADYGAKARKAIVRLPGLKETA